MREKPQTYSQSGINDTTYYGVVPERHTYHHPSVLRTGSRTHVRESTRTRRGACRMLLLSGFILDLSIINAKLTCFLHKFTVKNGYETTRASCACRPCLLHTSKYTPIVYPMNTGSTKKRTTVVLL